METEPKENGTSWHVDREKRTITFKMRENFGNDLDDTGQEICALSGWELREAETMFREYMRSLAENRIPNLECLVHDFDNEQLEWKKLNRRAS